MNDPIEYQLRQDRALRSAARALFHADLAHLRANLSGKSISSRIIDRIGDGAADVLDEAMDVAENHRGAIATLVAAIVLWFARHPIMALFSTEDEAEDADEDGAERNDRSVR